MAVGDLLSRFALSLTAKGSGASLPDDLTAEGPIESFGPVPPEIEKTIHGLVDDFMNEWKDDWEDWYRKAIRAQFFFRGDHFTVWNDTENRFSLLTDILKPDDIAPPTFKVNIYQAMVVMVMSFLTSNPFRNRYSPKNPTKAQDIYAAQAGTAVADMFSRNNSLQDRISEWVFHIATAGKVGLYLKFVEGDDDDVVEIEEVVETGPPELPGGPPQTDTIVYKIPEGREKLVVVNPVFLRMPAQIHDQKDFPYLIWDEWIHISEARKRYPNLADEIQKTPTQATGWVNDLSSDFLTTLSGSTPDQGNMVQVKHVWLRNSAFLSVNNKETREKLSRLFPTDRHFEFIAGKIGKQSEESMDDVWVIHNPLPGTDQLRPGFADPMIDANVMANDIVNMVVQAAERGIPLTIYDKRLGIGKSLKNQKATPGAMIGAVLEPSDSLPNKVFTTPPAVISGQAISLKDDMTVGPTMHVLSGVQPAFMGAPMQNTDTFSAYEMARDQSAGRLALVWRSMNAVWAILMPKVFKMVRKYRVADVNYTTFTSAGVERRMTIRQEDVQGEIMAVPESAENFPASWQQKQNRFFTFAQQAPQIAQSPDNLHLWDRYSGIDGIVIPGKDSVTKQLVEIEKMRVQPPMPMMPPAPATSPLMPPAPQQMPPGPQLPTVPVDEIDEHNIEASICHTWLMSKEGLDAKENEKFWYANVRAHFLMHNNYVKAAMAQQGPPGAPPQGPPGSGRPEGPPPGGPQGR